MSPTEKRGIKIAAQNRKAFHDYFVEDKYEAGIELAGTEVKSIRAGTLNLKDAYCTVKDGELFVHGMHISPYEKGNIFNKDPVRTRRLLMHKREIRKLHALIKQDGYTLVPLSVYFKDARVKVEVGLCKGKKNYDKRAADAQRDAKREIRKLHALIKQDGYTLVPLSVYFKDARVKLEVGLCKGKKNYDKRAATAQRDARREMDRTLKERNR